MFAQSRGLLKHVLAHQGGCRVRLERESSCHHFVHHGPERVDVDLGIQIFASLTLLRRHIQRHSQDHPDRGFAHRTIEEFGDPEVEQLHPLSERGDAVGHHKNVLRFQVSVNDVLFVDQAERGRGLSADFDDHLESERGSFVLRLLDPRQQLPSLQELHHDVQLGEIVRLVRRLGDGVDLDNVGVRELLEDGDF